MAIKAKQTILAEGARGSLSQKVIQKFGLAEKSDPQIYGLGFKEIWEVDGVEPGQILHSVGFPLNSSTYGGGFLYTPEPNVV